KKSRNALHRLLGKPEFRWGGDRFPDRLVSHEFFFPAGYHRGEIFRNDLVRFSFEVYLTVLHPNRAIRETAHRPKIVRYEQDRHAILLELLDAPDASLLKENVSYRQCFIDD